MDNNLEQPPDLILYHETKRSFKRFVVASEQHCRNLSIPQLWALRHSLRLALRNGFLSMRSNGAISIGCVGSLQSGSWRLSRFFPNHSTTSSIAVRHCCLVEGSANSLGMPSNGNAQPSPSQISSWSPSGTDPERSVLTQPLSRTLSSGTASSGPPRHWTKNWPPWRSRMRENTDSVSR